MSAAAAASSFAARQPPTTDEYLHHFYNRIDALHERLPLSEVRLKAGNTAEQLRFSLESIRSKLDPGPREYAHAIQASDADDDETKAKKLERVYRAAADAAVEYNVNMQQWIARREAAHKKQHALILELAAAQPREKYHGLTSDKGTEALALKCETMLELRPSIRVPGILGVFARCDIKQSHPYKETKTKVSIKSLLPYPGLVGGKKEVYDWQKKLCLPYPAEFNVDEEKPLHGKVIMGDPLRIAAQINSVSLHEEAMHANCKFVTDDEVNKNGSVSGTQMYIIFTKPIQAGRELLLCYDDALSKDPKTFLQYEAERPKACDICQHRAWTPSLVSYACPVAGCCKVRHKKCFWKPPSTDAKIASFRCVDHEDLSFNKLFRKHARRQESFVEIANRPATRSNGEHHAPPPMTQNQVAAFLCGLPVPTAEDHIRFFHSRPVTLNMLEAVDAKYMYEAMIHVPKPIASAAGAASSSAAAASSARDEYDEMDEQTRHQAIAKRSTKVALQAAQRSLQSASGGAAAARESSDEEDEPDEERFAFDKFPLTAAPINFTADGHYEKLGLQRDLLIKFGKERVLTLLKKHRKWYLKSAQLKGAFTPLQLANFKYRFDKALPQGELPRKPAGFTTVLRVDLKGNTIDPSNKKARAGEFDLLQNLKDMWEVKPSRHLPGSLGVFARQDIEFDDNRQGLEFLKHLIPMPGLIMTQDAANVANTEFECPTQIGKAELKHKDSFNHMLVVEPGQPPMRLKAPHNTFTLIGDPMCRGAIINSAAHTHITPLAQRTDEAQEARINCEYAAMQWDHYKDRKAAVLMDWFVVRSAKHDRKVHTNYAIHVKLTKRIAQGDELLINYGSSFFEEDNVNLPACERCQLKFNEKEKDQELLEMYGVSGKNLKMQRCTYKDAKGNKCSNVRHIGCGVWIDSRCSVHSMQAPAAAASASASGHKTGASDLDKDLDSADEDDNAMTDAMANLDELMLKVNLRQ